MTNYVKYPWHRFSKNSCVIHFNNGDFSWCMLYNSQKRYLLESKYLDNAKQVDIKTTDGMIYEFPIKAFKAWITSGILPAEYLRNSKRITTQETDKVCPLCGNSLTIRIAKKGVRAGTPFWGCNGYPNCKYTENIKY